MDESDAKPLNRVALIFSAILSGIATCASCSDASTSGKTTETLMAAFQLVENDGIDLPPLAFTEHFGSHRRPSRRQLIDEGNLHVTVNAMAKLRGIGVALISNMCGWRLAEPFARRLSAAAIGAARHEAMLLIDHAQSHARRAHLLLNQGMGADDESRIGTLNGAQQRFSLAA